MDHDDPSPLSTLMWRLGILVGGALGIIWQRDDDPSVLLVIAVGAVLLIAAVILAIRAASR